MGTGGSDFKIVYSSWLCGSDTKYLVLVSARAITHERNIIRVFTRKSDWFGSLCFYGSGL